MGISPVQRVPVIRQNLVRGNRGISGPAGVLPSIIADGLVAEYRCNDGPGQVLTDYSGNEFHGQLGSTAGEDTNDPSWGAEGLTYGADDAVALPVLTSVVSDLTLQFAIHPTGGAYLFDSQAGRFLCAYNFGGGYNYYDGGSHVAAEAITTDRQILTFHCEDVGDKGAIYRNLTALTLPGGTDYNPDELGGFVSLGSENDGFGQHYVGLMAYVAIYNRALSDDERIHNYNAIKTILTVRNSAWGDLP